MTIYTRWGKLLYSLSPLLGGVGGEEMPEDSYIMGVTALVALPKASRYQYLGKTTYLPGSFAPTPRSQKPGFFFSRNPHHLFFRT
uniref:Uncharacterized protein n=1 Tax=Planktothricoides sp. SpSt-374 TaxID=2282167 RepID=A0A7C3VL88_9CYAN